MDILNKAKTGKKERPIKVVQFGEGNFLRGFVDYMIDIANEQGKFDGDIVLIKPIEFGNLDMFHKQDCQYTVSLRGNVNGEAKIINRIVTSVADAVDTYNEYDKYMGLAEIDTLRFVVSNTTEAGIAYTQGDSEFDQVPPNSFPAKLTRVLYERYKAFNGAADKGLVILSCELIDNNGKELKKCCNNYAKDWNLEAEFIDWMNNANTFCSTLVDRIVPGRIRDPQELAALEEANGYHDAALDVGEVFGVWVIEGPAGLEDKLPFKKAGVNVMVVPDVTPYKKRKVRILNGAHTGFVLGAYLAGFDIVRDCMHNDTVRGFMNKMLHEEIIPTLPLDKKDLEEFASAVEDRFNNPFVNHELMSISLNSTSKWKARNMPSFLAYIEEQKQLPKCLTMSLAAYIAFYSNDIQERTADGLICKRPAGNTYKIQDDAWALDFYYAHKDDTAAQLVHAVLTNTQMWDQDLTKIEGLEAAVLADLELIRTQGAEAAYKSCL